MLAIFNSLGGGELIAILVIALIVLGPEKLPDAIRKFGNIYGELRRMSHGFQSELRDAFDEPMRELRGTARMMQDAVNDPVQSVTSQMKAPVVGGAATAATAAGPAAEASAAGEVQAPVEDAVVGPTATAAPAGEPTGDTSATEVAPSAVEPAPSTDVEPEPAAEPTAVEPAPPGDEPPPVEVVAAEAFDDAPAPDTPTEQAG